MESRYSKYLHIRFKPRGRDYEGCDCWGLVRLVYKNEFGVELPTHLLSCTDAAAIHRRVKTEKSGWCRIAWPEAPCVVAMRNDRKDPELVNHFGLFVGDNRVLHIAQGMAYAGRFRLDDPQWSRKIEGFYVPRR